MNHCAWSCLRSSGEFTRKELNRGTSRESPLRKGPVKRKANSTVFMGGKVTNSQVSAEWLRLDLI